MSRTFMMSNLTVCGKPFLTSQVIVIACQGIILRHRLEEEQAEVKLSILESARSDWVLTKSTLALIEGPDKQKERT